MRKEVTGKLFADSLEPRQEIAVNSIYFTPEGTFKDHQQIICLVPNLF